MDATVVLSKKAAKSVTKLPKQILILFDLWIEVIETDGYAFMKSINGYRDHALHGERKGQRSSSLNKSWRVIYVLNEEFNQLEIEVIEVNNHAY